MTIYSSLGVGSGGGSTGVPVAFTPIAKGSGGDPAVTYTQQAGEYVLIGKLCYVTMFLSWNGGGYVGGAGNAGFSLPFPASSVTDLQQGFVFISGGGRGEGYVASVAPGESVAYVGDAGGLISVATQAGLGGNNVSGCYIIA